MNGGAGVAVGEQQHRARLQVRVELQRGKKRQDVEPNEAGRLF